MLKFDACGSGCEVPIGFGVVGILILLPRTDFMPAKDQQSKRLRCAAIVASYGGRVTLPQARSVRPHTKLRHCARQLSQAR